MTAIAPAAQRGSDFSTLVKAVRSAGLFERRLASYGIRGALTLGAYAATCLAIVWVGNSWYQLINAVVFGLVWGQLAFLGHDAGHQAILGLRLGGDSVVRVMGDVLVGLSYGWWVDAQSPSR